MDPQLIRAIESVAGPNWTSVLQAIGAIGALVVAIIGFGFIYVQVRHVGNALRSNAHGLLYGQGAGMLKALLEYPDAFPYFFEGKSIATDAPEYRRVHLLAQAWAAHFEHAVMQGPFLPSDSRRSWVEYIRSLYSTSPILREYLRENGKCYMGELHQIVKDVQPVQQAPAMPAVGVAPR